jgi:hypothetical protein
LDRFDHLFLKGQYLRAEHCAQAVVEELADTLQNHPDCLILLYRNPDGYLG